MPIYDILEKNYEAFIQMPHHPAYLMLGLILISFLFEDIAVAAGVALTTAGSLSWSESFLAVWFGIVVGDLLLYASGYYSRKIPFLKRRFVDRGLKENNLLGIYQLAGAIFIARVTPGLRLVSYVYMGLKNVNLWTFTWLVMFSVMVWTASLYLGSLYLGSLIAEALPIPMAVAVALPLLVLALITLIYPWFQARWRRV